MITGFLFGIIAGCGLCFSISLVIAGHVYREPVASPTGDCGND